MIENDTAEEEWSEIRETLDENTRRILDKHAKNIKMLQIKEIDLYRMLVRFEYMENVLDS